MIDKAKIKQDIELKWPNQDEKAYLLGLLAKDMGQDAPVSAPATVTVAPEVQSAESSENVQQGQE